jgi:hypothetical protein
MSGAMGRTDLGGGTDAILSVGVFDATGGAAGAGAAWLVGGPMWIVGADGRAWDLELPPMSMLRVTMTDGGAAAGGLAGAAAGLPA